MNVYEEYDDSFVDKDYQPEPRNWFANLWWRYKNLERSTTNVADLRPWHTIAWFGGQIYFVLRGLIAQPFTYWRGRKARSYVAEHLANYERDLMRTALEYGKRNRTDGKIGT